MSKADTEGFGAAATNSDECFITPSELERISRFLKDDGKEFPEDTTPSSSISSSSYVIVH